MPNRAERRRHMKINELREQAIEAMNQTPYIDVETENGEVFRVWHPLLTDDEAQIRIDHANAGEDLDKDEDGNPKVPHRINGKLAEPFNIRTARAILGVKDHARFIKAGGRSNDVQIAWNEMVREYEDMLDGDSDPKSE
jgi:hypothetical protein